MTARNVDRARDTDDDPPTARRSNRGAWTGLALLSLVGIATVIVLGFVIERSHDRARADAFERFDERGVLAAKLLSDAFSVSSANNAPAAQAELSGPLTSAALREWEGEQDSTTPYTVVFGADGKLLAEYPANTKAATSTDGRAALAAARTGQPGTSGVIEFAGEPIIELFIPYTTTSGQVRVMVAGIEADVISQLSEGLFRSAAGDTKGAGAVVLDRSGTVLTTIGRGASAGEVTGAMAAAAGVDRLDGSVGDRRFELHPVEHSGLLIGLVAPERELLAGIPSATWPRLALLGLATALTGIILLGVGLIRARHRLVAARHLAELATEAKGQFLIHVTHELKTPLAVIRGFADLLKTEDLGARQREYVERIDESGGHLARLAEDLLEVARVEVGQVTLAIERVDMRDVVEEMLLLAAPLAAERRIRLEPPRVRETLPTAYADQMRLRQVLLNLLSNAVKYNRDDGVVHVEIVHEQDRVRVSVTDTGTGIAAADLERLFQPFERLGAAGGNVPGSGLGLCVSKGLIEAMNGSMVVESRVGHGSTFSFSLPAASADDVLEPATSEPVMPARSGDLVYIDDSGANLQLVERLVEASRPGLVVRTARDGTSGMELVLAATPDLLLLDLNLPDMHGEDVLRRLRAGGPTADVPVLVVSADSTSRDVTRLLRTGADAYLTKPLDSDQFLQVVDRLLASRS